MSSKHFMFETAELNTPYNQVAYYRCMGIEKFVTDIQKEKQIVGIEVDGNNLGFIVTKKKEETNESDNKTDVGSTITNKEG